MKTPNRPFPTEYHNKKLKQNHLAESFPFYIKEYGYGNKKKLIFDMHNSYNSFLLLYSIEGTARYTKDKFTNYIQQNSITISACNTPLHFTTVSKEWRYYYFIISGSHAKLFYNHVRTRNNIILNNPFTKILDYFMDTYDLINGNVESYNDTWKYMNISLQIHNIFTAIYDLNTDINQVKKLTPAQETYINLTLKYIANNYQNDLSVDTICNNIGFSKYYFCKLFKQQQGITIHQYVTNYRINKAKELLAYSKLSVNTIATHVGFKNSLTFIRAFERIENMTPTEYRGYYQ
ncbi:MAG: helix-turn-helix transcriptional regulator [Ruminococcus sp.]|nr:helix-turn-helix transcriptional regulator [Ruminococcus sp.]